MRAWVILPLLVVSWPAGSAAQVPAGGEFQVNTYTTGVQGLPSAGMDAAGRLVVSWTNPISGGGTFARRFAATGAPLSGELPVDVGTVFHTSSHVASSFAGDFVVTWVNFIGGPLGSSRVAGQRFSAGGTPEGSFIGSFQDGLSPMTAWTPAGGFVVVWGVFNSIFQVNPDVWGQRFDSSGARVGAQFRVNTYTTSNQLDPAVAVNLQGEFLVAWQSLAQDGSGYGVYAQRFDPAGATLGGEFRVNDITAADQAFPQTAIAADGGFIVVWQSDGQDGSGGGIFGRRLAGDGTPLGADFQVNTHTTSDQLAPAIAADNNGNFVVSWTSSGQDGSLDGIFAQRFTSTAERRGTEFRVNATTANAQARSSVAMDPFGNMSFVWDSVNQDGDSLGVFGRRFGGLYGVALDVDTPGNQVLEPGETVEVRPSWRNLNGIAQTLGGQLTVIVGPSGATYTITDATASYGTVADGATAPCVDCYGVAVSNPPVRPATHWDAFAPEAILPDAHGQRKPWALHVGSSFTDTPPANPFYRFIETLLHHGITAGCSGTTYCPASSTTRQEMAVFVLVAKEGAGFVPPACVAPNRFDDVPETSTFCRWIEELANRGVVGGCGGDNFCPGNPVTREQMAVFVLRTLDPALTPPACGTPVFSDVPASSSFCPWIEELVRRGVVSGCGGSRYCPADPVSREQMGVFLGVTFGLTLYGA